jgi:hypothetical protein
MRRDGRASLDTKSAEISGLNDRFQDKPEGQRWVELSRLRLRLSI